MSRLPPGPKGRLLTTYRVLSRPYEWMPRWRDRYGDPFMLSALNGDAFMTGQPELVREIFRADPSHYAPFGVEAGAPLIGESSVILTKGERHRQDRKLIMPTFHGERMRAYAELMREVTRRHLDRAAESGEPQTMLSLGQAISLDVIIKAVFGVTEAERVEAFHRGVLAFVSAFAPSLSFMKFLQRDWWPAWRTFEAEAARFDALIGEQIELTRARGPADDILSLLLAARYDDGEAMADRAVRDQLRTLLFAGHETTAVTLAFAVDLLWRDSEALSQAQREAGEPPADAPARALTGLPYIEGVCKETLRLRPVITEVLRLLETPLTIGDYELPAGVAVAPTIILVHRDPSLYPDPERFDPTRFATRRYAAYEYLPFGGGHRRCLGAAFALFEMQIVLATILREFELELRSPALAPIVRRGITLAPGGGVPIRVRRRAAASPRPADPPEIAAYSR